MDYSNHYSLLIFRAKNRKLNPLEYYEKHHIIPKCLGGSDDNDNIVLLTGREHFIAHQLLVRIHLNNHSLIRAANMMCSFNELMNRSQNRLYDWLRKQLIEVLKSQTGDKNSQFGTCWIYHTVKKENKKIDKSILSQYINEGWLQGRKLIWDVKKCRCCGSPVTGSVNKVYCSKECRDQERDSVFNGREQELISHFQQLGSLNKAIKAMGFPGAMGGWYHQAKKIINKAS